MGVCPKCKAVNDKREFTCERCGTALVPNSELLDTLTYWEDGTNKYSLPSAVIMAAAIAAALLANSIMPIVAGVAFAGIFYVKGHR